MMVNGQLRNVCSLSFYFSPPPPLYPPQLRLKP